MGEVEFQFQENITGIGYFIKICKKSAATEGFFLPSPLLRTKILLNCFADENYSRDQNLCGHFEETVIYHFKKIEGAVASFERIVQTFKGHFLLLYNKSIQLHLEEKIIIISKKTAARHSYHIGTEVNFPCHFLCLLFLCSENALPFGDFTGVFVAVSIFFVNRNGDAFEKIIINHFERTAILSYRNEPSR